MLAHQQKFRRQRKGATLETRDPVQDEKPQPTEVEQHRRWQTLQRIIKRRQLYAGNPLARRQGFRVGCAKCNDDLPVAIVDAQDSPELLERQTALMLACGHIFCYCCLESARDKDHEDECMLSCPVCEAEMQCRHCGHLPSWVPIPRSFDGPESVDQVPLTMPQGDVSPSSRIASEEWMANGEEWVVQVLKDEQRGDMCNPIEEGLRRVLYRIIDDMEKGDYVELNRDDVLSRLGALAEDNVIAVWDQRKDYLARREAVNKAPDGDVGGSEDAMPAMLGGLELMTDEMLDERMWESSMMDGM